MNRNKMDMYIQQELAVTWKQIAAMKHTCISILTSAKTFASFLCCVRTKSLCWEGKHMTRLISNQLH